MDHIARHQVTTEEVEEVCHGEHVVLDSHHGRLLVIGSTKSKRAILVILDPEPVVGVYYVVTARSADRKERRIYKKIKGGVLMKKITRDALPGSDSSRAKLARFWDTHSAADYIDELKHVRVRFAKNLSQGITIRFDSKTLTKLRRSAKQKGIGPTTLARMWILERLGVPI